MPTLRQWFGTETLLAAMAPPNTAAPKKQPGAFQQDDTDMNQNNAGPGGQKNPLNPGGGGPGIGQMQPPDQSVVTAPYVKMLTKLGYEFQGHDEDMQGMPIGNTFQGQDGDTVYVKPDGSWIRFGPGAMRAQGPDVNSLGTQLVRGALQEGDDKNPHTALRQAGYMKVHTDDDGNSYYKHPQSGKMVTTTKDGRWNSSVGSGRGATKLRDFLGNEQMNDADPQMQQMKLKQQQMKQQSVQQRQQQQQQPRPGQTGTRGTPGTRQQPMPRPRFGNNGGNF